VLSVSDSQLGDNFRSHSLVISTRVTRRLFIDLWEHYFGSERFALRKPPSIPSYPLLKVMPSPTPLRLPRSMSSASTLTGHFGRDDSAVVALRPLRHQTTSSRSIVELLQICRCHEHQSPTPPVETTEKHGARWRESPLSCLHHHLILLSR